MSKLQFSMDLLKDNALMIVAAVVAAIAIYAVVTYFMTPSEPAQMMALNEPFASPKGGHKLIMFGTDWCPHCVKTAPIYANLGATQTIGGKTVEILKINPETDENPYKDTVKIAGFPTIVLIDPTGTVSEYDGPRTEEGMLGFLAEKLA
jgi:thiol-disulfide isomerase/thioredoxin